MSLCILVFDWASTQNC